MNTMNKYYRYLVFLILLLIFLLPASALAVCPVCTVAVGAGVGLSRYLGIDDLIIGLWIGGFAVSSIMWTINYLNSKKIKFYGRKILVTILYYVLIIWPLYSYNFVGHPLNKLFGVDKLFIGIAIGSIFFLLGDIWYQAIKKNNNGKAKFNFQKIVMPVAPLIILSVAFYFLTK